MISVPSYLVQCAMLRIQKLAYEQLYNLDKERRLLGCLFLSHYLKMIDKRLNYDTISLRRTEREEIFTNFWLSSCDIDWLRS